MNSHNTHTQSTTHTQSRLVLSKESWPYMASHVMASRVAASHFNAARPCPGTASVHVVWRGVVRCWQVHAARVFSLMHAT